MSIDIRRIACVGHSNERRAIRLDSTVQIYNRKTRLSSILTIIFILGLNFLLRLLTLSLCHIVTGGGVCDTV